MAHKKNLGLAKTSELVWYSARIPLAGHPLETELSNGKRKIWGTEPYSSWWCSEQETRMRKPVSLEKRIGLYRVSTGKSYRLGGLHFDLGKSIAKVVCQEVDEALYRKKDWFIRFTCVADEVQEVMNDFEEEYHFPQIVGAVDGCASKSMHHRETKKTTLTGNSITASTCKGYSILSNIISFPGSIYDVRVL